MFRKSRYELEPEPFWCLVEAIEETLSDDLPGYRVFADDRDEVMLTQEEDPAYAIEAVEQDTFRGMGVHFRQRYRMKIDVPQQLDVDTFIVLHGMQGSAVYELLVDDKTDTLDAVMDGVSDRLDNDVYRSGTK